ncbi:MAG TPA: EamA family transporter [Vicinamibacteria bacterium]
MSPRHRRLLPWIALFVIYVVWGSTYMAIRIAVRELPPMAAACLRFLVAGVVMALVAAVVHRPWRWPTRRQWLDYSLIGVLFLGLGNAFVMWSETRIPSGIAALIVATVPLWLTLLDGLRPGGQPWTVRAWLGTLVGLAGAALVARPQGGVAPGHWPGIVALEVATISWAVGALYSQSVKERLPLFTAAAVEMLAGSAALLGESALMGDDWGRVAQASSSAWLAMLYLVVFGSLVGFTAFAYCLNELPATTVGTYAYVNPVVAVALGAIFLHEPLSPSLLAGAGLILIAVILTTTARMRRAAPRPVSPPPAVVAVPKAASARS